MIMIIFSSIILILNNKLNKTIATRTSKLEKVSEELIKAERLSAIGELSSRLAHDIRNPLAIIQISYDILKNSKNLSENDRKKFLRVDLATQRIVHQIDDVLDFIKNRPLNLKINSFLDILNSALTDMGIPENVTLEKPSNDFMVLSDYESMKIVFINLIMNAIQAIEKTGTIKIRFQENPSQYIIEVEDSGNGIPDDYLEKIFDPVFTTKQEGTGLGLTSCKSIIENHGGTIYAKNRPTTFTIILLKKETKS